MKKMLGSYEVEQLVEHVDGMFAIPVTITRIAKPENMQPIQVISAYEFAGCDYGTTVAFTDKSIYDKIMLHVLNDTVETVMQIPEYLDIYEFKVGNETLYVVPLLMDWAIDFGNFNHLILGGDFDDIDLLHVILGKIKKIDKDTKKLNTIIKGNMGITDKDEIGEIKETAVEFFDTISEYLREENPNNDVVSIIEKLQQVLSQAFYNI